MGDSLKISDCLNGQNRSAGGGGSGSLGRTFSAGALGTGLAETALENLAAARAWITLAHLIIASASGGTGLIDGSRSQ